MSLHIRKAVKEDVAQIFQFIKDLALFEKAPEAVFATEEKLSSTLGFTGQQFAHAVIAEVTSETAEETPAKTVGMAIYFYNYSTWHAAPGIYLEDLYVDQQERGKGYGTKLLQHLAKLSLDMGGKRLEKLLHVRWMQWMSPCPFGGYDSWFGRKMRGFLHGTAVGRFIVDQFWGFSASSSDFLHLP